MEIIEIGATKILSEKITIPISWDSLNQYITNKSFDISQLKPDNHNLWDWQHSDILKIKEIFTSGFERWAQLYNHELNLKNDVNRDLYLSHAWAQIYQNGTSAPVHAHNFSDATAVLYSTNCDSDLYGGTLEIYDPRWVSDEMLYVNNESTTLRIKPEQGLLVIFPGYLWHRVSAYTGPTPRIALATTFEYSLFKRAQRLQEAASLANKQIHV
jgi:hypothetical protein